MIDFWKERFYPLSFTDASSESMLQSGACVGFYGPLELEVCSKQFGRPEPPSSLCEDSVDTTRKCENGVVRHESWICNALRLLLFTLFHILTSHLN
jgi:hypothetical protein